MNRAQNRIPNRIPNPFKSNLHTHIHTHTHTDRQTDRHTLSFINVDGTGSGCRRGPGGGGGGGGGGDNLKLPCRRTPVENLVIYNSTGPKNELLWDQNNRSVLYIFKS